MDRTLTADQIKAMYGKYQGWNDAASIVADYQAGNAGQAYGAVGTVAQPTTSGQFLNIDPTLFQLPTQGQLDTYMSQAFEKLRPYYEKLLLEAKGDFGEATRRLEYDYQTGMRQNAEDTSLSSQRQKEDLVSALNQLGITFKGETESKLDSLNKRGIALVEDPTSKGTVLPGGQMTYDASGRAVYSGTGGQAGSELAMLSEDQRLRKEAETRAAQRNLQDIGIKSTRRQEELGQTKQRSEFDVGRQYQTKLEDLQQQKEQQATTMAQTSENRAVQQKQLDLQRQQLEAQQRSLGMG